MAEPLLLVPGYGVSPRACDDVPALHAMLDGLREHFDVTIFHWPSVRGGPEFPPTWQGAADALREALLPVVHLVTRGGNITYALMAIKGAPIALRSIVADGIDIPVATLNALGMHSLARAAEAAVLIESIPQQSSRIWMQDAEESVAAEITRRMYQDTDWAYCEKFARNAQQLNLVEQAPEVHTPTLFVESGHAYPGWDQREIFPRFFPNSEFAEVTSWQLHDPASGTAFADKAIAFMQMYSGRTILSTVLFADIVDSTVHAATMGDRRWSQLLGQIQSLAGREVEKSRGKLVDTAGDGFLAVFDDPAAAIRCASAIGRSAGELGLETRAGVHTGQVEVSGDKYSGIAVHTAARVAARAAPGEILVSDTVRQLLAGSALSFEDRGSHELKGFSEPLKIYSALVGV
jgi:class 3 adenylate cyclase